MSIPLIAQDKQLHFIYPYNKSYEFQTGLCVSNDGRKIAFSYSNGKIKIVDLMNGKVISRIESYLNDLYEIRFTSDGERLVSFGDRDKICVNTVVNGSLERVIQTDSSIVGFAIGKINNYISVGQYFYGMAIYDLNTGNLIKKIPMAIGNYKYKDRLESMVKKGKRLVNFATNLMDFSPSKPEILFSFWDNMGQTVTKVYDYETNEIKFEATDICGTGVFEHPNWMKFTPDGNGFFAFSNKVRFFNNQNGFFKQLLI